VASVSVLPDDSSKRHRPTSLVSLPVSRLAMLSRIEAASRATFQSLTSSIAPEKGL
jgi:hypothetical protein